MQQLHSNIFSCDILSSDQGSQLQHGWVPAGKAAQGAVVTVPVLAPVLACGQCATGHQPE